MSIVRNALETARAALSVAKHVESVEWKTPEHVDVNLVAYGKEVALIDAALAELDGLASTDIGG